jgi:uncharacterized protein (UPF0332 family)
MYGECFGQAVAAENIAKNAERIAKKSKQIQKRGAKLIEDIKEDLIDLEEKISKAKVKGIDTSEIEKYLNEAMEALAVSEDMLGKLDYGKAASNLEKAKMRIAVASVVLKKIKKVDLREDAVEAIGDAEEDIIEIEAKIESARIKGLDIASANDLIERAKSSLEEAKKALEKGEYEKAISLAKKAKLLKSESKKALDLAREAKKLGKRD